MEIRSINSITEFAFFKIKRSLFHFILTVIGLAILYFFILESIYHLEWIRNGLLEIENKNFASAFFYTFIVVCIATSLGLVSLDIYLIIIMIKEYKKIKYYKFCLFFHLNNWHPLQILNRLYQRTHFQNWY